MIFYMEIDPDTDYVLGWSSTPFTHSEREVKMHLPNDHPFFEAFGRYRYKGSMLFEDLTQVIAEAKANKAEELSQSCKDAIYSGFDYEINGKAYHFSYDAEAQSNFQTTQNLFFQGAIQEARWTAKENGEYTLLQLDKIDFESLQLAGYLHKEDQVIKLRMHLLPALEKLSSIELIDEVKWS